MNFVQNIFSHEKNQSHIYSQLKELLHKSFNMNVDNIPNIKNTIQIYMYNTYKTFINTKSQEYGDQSHQKTLDPYEVVKELNKNTLESLMNIYINEFTNNSNTVINPNNHNHLHDTYTPKSEDNFTLLGNNQSHIQQQHLDKIYKRSFNRDTFMEERNSHMQDIYSQQEFNPRKFSSFLSNKTK